MELTLEISEGSKYNNLIHEIEQEFFEYNERAEYCFFKNEYEKCIQYYRKCLTIDPDNNHVKYIRGKLSKVVNKYFREIYSCAFLSFHDREHELSKYYFTKCYCLLIENQDYIHDRYSNQLDKIIDMLNEFEHERSCKDTVVDLNYFNFYKIKLK